jgi:ergothioneine biosynthesis protein EgtB
MSATLKSREAAPKRLSLTERYRAVRGFSERLCETLEPEDCTIQSMPDVSPTRWHLAHTTWFFEEFVLKQQPWYRPSSDQYAYLFNSYYNAVGKQFPRAKRGLLSRPTVAEVFEYRHEIDGQMLQVLEQGENQQADIATIVELGLNHEQQHQELMLTDIKHVLSCNPLYPVYREGRFEQAVSLAEQSWIDFDEGLYWIGYDGEGFAYDNESPRHRVFLEAFQLSNRLVTNGEFLDFINDRGYARPELWLSEGWRHVTEEGWQAPFYWLAREGTWFEFTLAGLNPLDPNRPACHVSYFEADAFARWAGARLPTEAEWEVASEMVPIDGRWADTRLADGEGIHPNGFARGATLAQMFGDVWQWTGSAYLAYPGYRPAEGALGEYNGKFMCNQFVLRGGSCATPSGHIRRTYRNFFPPEARWQFSGIRLAK